MNEVTKTMTKNAFNLAFLYLLALAFLPLEAAEPPTIGLVLSGGGAKGIAHIGVIKVLEEAGIPIDYIGGTSMGSIVGGLYAIGYNIETIEAMAHAQDWEFLLTDKLRRPNLSVIEKEEYDKYLLSFPVEKFRVKLPSGLATGQNVALLLSHMAVPVSHINDFHNFHRPFICTATDIVTGEEVVLDHGYLPDAIRASMAIPTVFTPVEIDGRLLVDGGLVNNFPVERVIEMGADIIIGVNLGLKDYNKDELQNLATILEQSLFFQNKARNKFNRELCDYLITPKVNESYAATSFTDIDAMIKMGEDAARQILPQLIRLADSINQLRVPTEAFHLKQVDSIYISSVEYTGLNNVSRTFIEGKLKISPPCWVGVSELENGIERALGTQFFNNITYKLEKESLFASRLIIRVDEKTNDLFRLGARFDSQLKTQLLLNVTLRNKLIKGSKSILDIHLGSFPQIVFEYRLNTGWKPPRKETILKNGVWGLLPDVGFRFDSRRLEVSMFDSTDLTSTFNYSYQKMMLFASNNINNGLYAETGASIDFSNYRSLVSIRPETSRNEFGRVYALLKADTYNKRAYPNKGSLGIITGEMAWALNDDANINTAIYRWIVKYEKAIPITKELTLFPRINAGMAYGDSIPTEYTIFQGNGTTFKGTPDGYFQFNGLKYWEVSSNAAINLGLTFQYNILQNHFLTFEFTAGTYGRYIETAITNTSHYLTSMGLSYGYNSVIGPIEIGFFGSTQNDDWTTNVNIGFRF